MRHDPVCPSTEKEGKSVLSSGFRGDKKAQRKGRRFGSKRRKKGLKEERELQKDEEPREKPSTIL